MKKNINPSLRLMQFSLCSFIIFCAAAVPAFSQDTQKMKKDTAAGKPLSMGKEGEDEVEIAHPFFTHMGMPDRVGSYSLRVPVTATVVDGKTQVDFGFHFEMGLTKNIGLHIRNDRFLNNSHSEIMFQFAAIRSKDGMSGFSPIIEFEIPTKKGASRINTLVGFSTAYVRPRFAFNQVIHYGPREDMLEGSAALVYRVTKGVFLVVEIFGEKFPSESVALNMLGGVKVSVGKYLTLGVGYRGPISKNKEFSSQYIFSPDVEWSSNRK